MVETIKELLEAKKYKELKDFLSDLNEADIAEVLSDSTEQDDRVKKMEVYAKVGVEEYWLIDWRIPKGRVERYLLDDAGEKYLLHDLINGVETDNLSLIMFPIVSFTMTQLMEHVGEDIF